MGFSLSEPRPGQYSGTKLSSLRGALHQWQAFTPPLTLVNGYTDRMADLDRQIIATHASTLRGLTIKARAACSLQWSVDDIPDPDQVDRFGWAAVATVFRDIAEMAEAST